MFAYGRVLYIVPLRGRRRCQPRRVGRQPQPIPKPFCCPKMAVVNEQNDAQNASLSVPDVKSVHPHKVDFFCVSKPQKDAPLFTDTWHLLFVILIMVFPTELLTKSLLLSDFTIQNTLLFLFPGRGEVPSGTEGRGCLPLTAQKIWYDRILISGSRSRRSNGGGVAAAGAPKKSRRHRARWWESGARQWSVITSDEGSRRRVPGASSRSR